MACIAPLRRVLSRSMRKKTIAGKQLSQYLLQTLRALTEGAQGRTAAIRAAWHQALFCTAVMTAQALTTRMKGQAGITARAVGQPATGHGSTG